MAKIIMSNKRLIELLWYIVNECKTIYGYAMYGWQITSDTIAIKARQNLNGWYIKAHIDGLKKVANEDPPVWGFDCVNLLKGILWGWTGDTSKTYGGAVHGANGVPDTNANGMIQLCYDVTTDFSHIEPGEGLWLEGHWGIYVGNGLAIECTGRWANGVQVTAVHNLGKRDGMNGRYWTKHGKIPWIEYEAIEDHITPETIELGSRILKRGMQGTDVQELQTDLMSLGYSLPKFGADGDFGKETEAAVKLFQDDRGIEADGVVGADTITALRLALKHVPADPSKSTYTVIIHGVAEHEMKAIKAKYPDCEVRQE